MYIIGDGVSSVKNLLNKSRLHGLSDKNYLKRKGYDMDMIVENGKKVTLSNTGNFHSGFKPIEIDIKDIHKDNQELFIKTNKIIGTVWNGLDYLGEDLSIPYYKCNGKIIESNSSPGLGISIEKKSKIVDRLIDNLNFK